MYLSHGNDKTAFKASEKIAAKLNMKNNAETAMGQPIKIQEPCGQSAQSLEAATVESATAAESGATAHFEVTTATAESTIAIAES